MDAKDLMIGDLVIHGFGGIGKITEIDSKTVVIKDDGFDTGDGMNEVSFALNELTPIPLTAEILEKNGFVKYNEVSDTPPYDQDEEGNMYYSYKGEQKFWGWWQPNNVYFIPVNAMLDLEIKYVHQLQHALRLCGIDKVITI